MGLNQKLWQMNRFILQGFVNTIKYLPDACLVYIDDFEMGYKRPNGEIVEDKYLSWKVIFPSGMKGFITKYFGNGMLVDIVAKMKPYEIEQDKIIEGYSCLGLSIQRASYPRSSVRQERKMIKESQMNDDARPNLEEFNNPDF